MNTTTTKRQTRRARANDRRARWNTAIREGRVVRYSHPVDGATACLTVAAAVALVAEYRAAGLDAVIVDPALAE